MRYVLSFSRLFSCANVAFVADYRRMLDGPSNFSGRWIAVVVAVAAATWLYARGRLAFLTACAAAAEPLTPRVTT